MRPLKRPQIRRRRLGLGSRAAVVHQQS